MPSRRQTLGLLAGLTGCAGRRSRTGRRSPKPTATTVVEPSTTTRGAPGDASWHRPRHDSGQSGFAPAGSLPADPTVRWTAEVYGDRTPPVVTDDGVFVAHAYGLFRFDRETGERVWTTELHGDDDVPTPADRTTTGTQTPYGVEHVSRVFRWPVFVGGQLVVGFGPWFLRVDAETGTIVEASKRQGFGPIHPVVDDDTTYLVFSDWVVAAGPTAGANRWVSSPGDVADAGVEATLQRPVVVAEDAVVVADDAPEASVYALDAATGEQRWAAIVGSPPLSLAARGDVVYAASHDGSLVARDVATGSDRWSVERDDPVDRVVVTDRTLYCGSDGGQLHARDRATGEHRFTTRGEPLAAASDGLVVSDGNRVRGLAPDGARRWDHPVTGHDAAVLDGMAVVTVEDALVALA